MSIVNRSEGYNPDFDLDIERGWVAEEELRAVLGELFTGGDRVEVKRDDRALETGNVYLEKSHKPRGSDIYKPSGLKDTKAEYFGFKIGNVLLVAPTQAWRYVGNKYGEPKACVVGDNPTKGAVVPLIDLIVRLSQAPF